MLKIHLNLIKNLYPPPCPANIKIVQYSYPAGIYPTMINQKTYKNILNLNFFNFFSKLEEFYIWPNPPLH